MGKVREIVLAKIALDKLLVWWKSWPVEVSDDDFVFGTIDGKSLGYEGLHNVLEKRIKEFRATTLLSDDGRWISCHSARHTLNTNLLVAIVPPLLVKSFLGWSSAEAKILTRVQAVYTHLTLLRAEDVAKAVDLMYAAPSVKKQADIRTISQVDY